ncbi:MAG: LytTR family DNA-binding domain-containing protein [Daejeonella sp.]
MALTSKHSFSVMEKALVSYLFVLCSIYAGRASVKRWFLRHNTMSLVIYSCTFIAVLSVVFAAYWALFINDDGRFHVEFLSISIPLTIIFMFIGSFLTLIRGVKNQRQDRIVIVPVKKEVDIAHDTGSAQDYLFIKTSGKVYKVAHTDILYAEANGNYTKVITDSGILIHNTSFSNFEQLLPPEHFARIHRSFIINKSKISHIEGNRVFLGPSEIPIGRNFKKNFFDLMGL